jgi:mannose-6-phosphate isomerase-like protein (cupin superfamily)
VNETLLETHEYTGDGYQPLVDYGAWRVACLRFAADMLPQNIHRFQRHDETDEVFVLLQGRCILYIGEGDQSITAVHAQDMEPSMVYNVKQKVWHNHTLSRDAVVLIVENRDTSDHNSPFCALTEEQRAQLIDLQAALWKDSKAGDERRD